MSVNWIEVDQSVIHTAEKIIKEFHPELEKAKIGFIYRSEASWSSDKMVIGHAKKVSSQDHPFMDYDFVIWLAMDVYQKYDQKRREALIDHELCHCFMTEDGEAKLRHHDIEEFKAIVERYGLWKSDLVDIAPAFENAIQLDLGLLHKVESVGSVSAISPDVQVSFD